MTLKPPTLEELWINKHRYVQARQLFVRKIISLFFFFLLVPLLSESAEDESLERLAHQGGDLEAHGLVDVMRDMNRFDAERLRQIIEKHVHYTDSSLGRKILGQWEFYQPQFVKVMPVDYRRALEEMEMAQSAEIVDIQAEHR